MVVLQGMENVAKCAFVGADRTAARDHARGTTASRAARVLPSLCFFCVSPVAPGGKSIPAGCTEWFRRRRDGGPAASADGATRGMFERESAACAAWSEQDAEQRIAHGRDQSHDTPPSATAERLATEETQKKHRAETQKKHRAFKPCDLPIGVVSSRRRATPQAMCRATVQAVLVVVGGSSVTSIFSASPQRRSRP